MKKLLGIVVLGLLWCNVGFADEVSYRSLNENIKKGYKITKETSSQKIKTFTLKNGKNEVVICVVYLADHETECWKP